MTHKILADLLVSSSLFQEMTATAVRELAEGFDVLRLKDGQVLVRQGETSQFLYLVIAGRLTITVYDAGHEPRMVFDCQEGKA